MSSRSVWVLVCAAGALLQAQSVPAFNISTYGGTPGTPGYAGDSGAPSLAEFNQPFGLYFANGNLYIADQVNNRLRMVSSNVTTTLAGDGSSGYSGDTFVATNSELFAPTGVALDTAGNIYIADTENDVVRQINTKGIIYTFAGSQALGAGSTATAPGPSRRSSLRLPGWPWTAPATFISATPATT